MNVGGISSAGREFFGQAECNAETVARCIYERYRDEQARPSYSYLVKCAA
jgi:hypothetical protein